MKHAIPFTTALYTACFLPCVRKTAITLLDIPIIKSTIVLSFSRKFSFNKLEKISSTSKQVYYFVKRRFFFKTPSLGLSVIKGFWIFRHNDRCRNGKGWEWRVDWIVAAVRMKQWVMITKSHSEEDLKTGSANNMKGKKRVEVGVKMLLVCNVKNMFSAYCHLPSINVTVVWDFLVKSGRLYVPFR